jgi:hypothetical protein
MLAANADGCFWPDRGQLGLTVSIRPKEVYGSYGVDDCIAAIAAGRVPQSLVSFMPEAVTQIQSSMLGPLTAFR